MGKIQFYIGEISGRVGGLVFSKNRSGNYVKLFTKQNNPSTFWQTLARSKFAELTTRWSLLTDDQRYAWDTLSLDVYDRFGVIRTLKGRELFICLNRNLQMAEQPILLDPPADILPPLNFSVEVTIEQSNIRLVEPYIGCYDLIVDFTGETLTGLTVLIYNTVPLRLTTTNPGHTLTWTQSGPITDEEVDITETYYDGYGAWPAAKYEGKFAIHYIVQIVKNSNGRTTPPILSSCIFGEDCIIYTP